MKHLVLGSSGQIGKYLVKELKYHNYDVIEFDIVNGEKEDLRLYNNKFLEEKIIECDFVHFLAFDIGGSIYLKKYQDSFEFISNNVKIMNNVFDLLKKYNKKFIFASSQMSNMSYSTYGILKSIGEKYTNSLNGINVNFWNVYGYEEDENKAHVITDFIKMAIQDKKILMKTDGSELRQFLYAEDCSECLIKLSENYDSIDRNKHLHITSFKWNTILDVANIIAEKFNTKIFPSKQKDDVQQNKKNEPNEYIKKYWSPKTSLQDGINKIINENYLK